MKTAMVVGVVITLHAVAAVVLLSPGCGTTKRTEPQRRTAVMPEPVIVTPLPDRPEPRPPIQPPLPPRPVAVERPVATVEYKEYVVLSNDVLSRIARRTGISVAEIMELNKLSNPNHIMVGQTLLLPPHAKVDAAASQAATPPATGVLSAVPADAATYEVQSGDALSAIAQRFGTTVQAIVNANNITDPNRIRAGQKLVIPGARTPAGRPDAPVTAPRSVPQARTPVPTIREPAAAERMTPVEPLFMDDDMEALVERSTGETIHVVRQGETLESVAALYNRRADEIQRFNALSSRQITTGQTLKIPRD